MPEPKVHVVAPNNDPELSQAACDCGWAGAATTDAVMADIEAAEHERDSGHKRCCGG